MPCSTFLQEGTSVCLTNLLRGSSQKICFSKHLAEKWTGPVTSSRGSQRHFPWPTYLWMISEVSSGLLSDGNLWGFCISSIAEKKRKKKKEKKRGGFRRLLTCISVADKLHSGQRSLTQLLLIRRDRGRLPNKGRVKVRLWYNPLKTVSRIELMLRSHQLRWPLHCQRLHQRQQSRESAPCCAGLNYAAEPAFIMTSSSIKRRGLLARATPELPWYISIYVIVYSYVTVYPSCMSNVK